MCKFTKDVGRSGREENPGNDLQTISYIFRKLDPGYAVAAVYRHSGPDVQSVLTRYQRRMKGRCRPGSSGPGKHSEREKAGAGSVREASESVAKREKAGRYKEERKRIVLFNDQNIKEN